MSVLNELTATAVTQAKNFNWIWLVELIVSGILVLFFLFYFNRLFATVISYALRAYVWHQFHIYIDIQALQISLLGGRIFFKGVRYHGENETVLIQNGYITWRYWMRSARQIDLSRYHKGPKQSKDSHGSSPETERDESSEEVKDEETGDLKKPDNTEARLAVNVTGLQWFLYNRTPAFDAIFKDSINLAGTSSRFNDEDTSARASGVDKEDANNMHLGPRSQGKTSKTNPVRSSPGDFSSLTAEKDKFVTRDDSYDDKKDQLTPVKKLSTVAATHHQLGPSQAPPPFILRFFPIEIECSKGAISVGNETTRALLVTTFDRAKGHVDASDSGPHDYYRQVFDFDIEHPVVQMRPNPDFRQTQMTAAERIINSSDFVEKKQKWWEIDLHLRRRRRKAWYSLRNAIPQFRRSVESLHSTGIKEKDTLHGSNWQDSQQVEGQWLGLGRYMSEDEGDDHEAWAHIDYARFSTLLNSPSVGLIFYWDVPGEVKDNVLLQHSPTPTDDINGSEPPSYGMDLIVRGAEIDYGPWADRLRAELQNAFFPNSYQSVHPAQRLKPGDVRQSTRMIIRVEIEAEVKLRIPTREVSKDWLWRGRANALRVAANIKKQRERKHFRLKRGSKRTLGPEVRPFGWISVSVEADTTVRYEMDLIPGSNGYKNHLDLDLKSTKATTSVNHDLLWRCKAQRLSCDLSNPLIWNSLHSWTFGVQNDALEFFLLRDHMFLLTDLISDFTSGPAADYMTFIPFHYNIDLGFSDLKLYLNTNDSNIIDNPCDHEENAFLILGLGQLHGKVGIPLQYYRPTQSSVLFEADGKNIFMELTTPLWNTLHTFMNDKPIATLKSLALKGTYNYCTASSPSLTDSLVLDIQGTAPRVFLHGFLIRYFMKIRDNYFGDDMHFRTLEEYQEALNSRNAEGLTNTHAPGKKENDLDVVLTVRADHSCALLPSNVYSRKENVRFDILLVEADLRFTNYYMDLQVSFSPLEACLESFASEDVATVDAVTRSQLFVNGLTVFGHRLFGAPPSEPTYVCNWDFNVGQIVGECSSTFVRTLAFAIRAIIFTIDEEENALPPLTTAIIHDLTFLRAHVDSIRLWLLTDSAALLLELSEINVDFNDWAGPNFSKNIQAFVPRIMFSAVDRKSASRVHDNTSQQVVTLACFQTAATVQVLDKKGDFARDRTLQQQHVRFHDQRSHRVDWLLHSQTQARPQSRQGDWARHPPAMQLPPMPEPISQLHGSIVSGKRSRRDILGRHNSRPSSFLSSPSTSSRSVVTKANGDNRLKSKGRTLSVRGLPLSELPNLRSHPGSNIIKKLPSTGNKEWTTLGGSVTFASPWSAPRFSLQHVKPDMAEMPQLPENLQSFDHQRSRLNDYGDGASAETVRGAQTGIFCTLASGLTGFCTPTFFNAIATLLRDLQPKHPIDLLDAVQIETMAQVLGSTTTEGKSDSVLDVAIRLPFLHIKLINDAPLREESIAAHQDQYDVIISRAHLNARIRSMEASASDTVIGDESPLLLQSVVDQISISVSERLSEGSDGSRASAEGTLTDVSFWVGSKQKTKAKVRARGIEIATYSKRREYLASLIQRTDAMTESLINDFKILSSKDNTKHLIYHLTATESGLADPIFLSRPSYVLRSAERHLRLSDSWKIMSRLRYIYETLPEITQAHIVQHATARDFELPEDAEQHVLSSFDHWRNWDHDRVESTPIMDVIFGKSVMPPTGARTSDDYEAEISIGSTALILDPGPQQNEILLGDLDLWISGSTTSTIVHHSDSQVFRSVQKIHVQIYLSQFTANLNWHIAELVGETLEKFESSETLLPVPEKPHHEVDSGLRTTELFVVFGTDQGYIKVDAINLSLRLAADNLQGSIANITGDLHREETSVLLKSSTGYAKLRSKNKALLGWQLAAPNIYTSIQPKKTSSARLLRVAGTCNALRFDLKEDIIGLLEIMNHVIDDEATFIHKITSRFPSTHQAHDSEYSAGNEKVEAHVALFLEDYKLKFKLLPNLTYTIAGKIARTSIIPIGKAKSMINFDLKNHSHSFQSEELQRSDTVPKFDIPPITGAISLLMTRQNVSVDVRSIVEQIVLEAAAVRGFIDAINQPGIARLIVDAKISVQRLMSKSENLFPSANVHDTKAPLEETGSTLQYSAIATLAGVNIHCSAPSLQDRDYRADLDLLLGSTIMRLHNRTDQENVVHKQPQFDINVQQIALELRRQSHGQDLKFGRIAFGMQATGVTKDDADRNKVQMYHASSNGLQIDLYPETASLFIDVAAFLQDRIKSFTLNEEARQFAPLRRLTLAGLDQRPEAQTSQDDTNDSASSMALFDSIYSLELDLIQARWILQDRIFVSPNREVEDLVFSIEKIDLKTKREGSARLAIINLQLQMVPKLLNPIERTSNSALLPEMIFNVAYLSTKQDRRFAFQAAGKALDLRLASDFIVPASSIQESVAKAAMQLREANTYWVSGPVSTPKQTTNLLGSKRLASLLVDADFAGAVVHIRARREEDHRSSVFAILKGNKRTRGRYGQIVSDDSATEASLQAPGVAFKVEYKDNGLDDPALSAEIKVAASNNVLYPSVVPLVLEISSSIKEIVGEKEQKPAQSEPQNTNAQSQGFLPETVSTGDPTAILGRCKLNIGLWIKEQKFSLSCQPIARVAATASFDDIFMTVNTVQAPDQDRFFALVMTFNRLRASVQHVYSRESTASFDVDSIVVSMMNSKHVGSTTGGISAILNVSPMRTDINAKQLQDFLLFREIWYPAELRQAPAAQPPTLSANDAQANVVARYQQVAAAGAFVWNAVISIQELKVQLDLGQGLGKSLFVVSKLWVSSKKDSHQEQNLCLGFEKIGVESTGRMSGFVELQDFRVRTSIKFPHESDTETSTPLIQGSIGFDHLRVKAAFDYQPFAVADISLFDFLIYNVRPTEKGQRDRLVGILNGDKVQVFGTPTSAAQSLGLYQAIERLIQEKEAAYEASLREVDRFMRRKSVFPSGAYTNTTAGLEEEPKDKDESIFSLHTDVVVTLEGVNLGVFPGTFFDNQIFKIEATDAQARFAVSTIEEKTHSALGLTLGELRVALASVTRGNTQALGDISVPDVIQRSTSSRGGTILKVPRVIATMQTWQMATSNIIEYIFKSTFEGKVDVGWNYSRISFIRGMWSAHARALAHRLGKPLPKSAVKITAEPQASDAAPGQEKITAVVNVPQSRFDYVALEPPIIDTPQLRDMGEATPPLEWIGLHRDRLPNVTHQIIIVTLLEVAREVEDAYSRILGSS